MSLFGHSVNREKKSIVLYLGERNLFGSHVCELKLSRNIYINQKESFMYGLLDNPRKDNTLLGSKLTSYFKQI